MYFIPLIIFLSIFIYYRIFLRTLNYTPLKFFSSRRNSDKSIDKLMIVAHPDDETIFGGNLLLNKKGWKVICITNASNSIRRGEFIHAMKLIKAEYEMWDHEDTFFNGNFHPQLIIDLTKIFLAKPYKLIVTHNSNGEYGHIQHKALHRIVRNILKSRKCPQNIQNLYLFSPNPSQKGYLTIRKQQLLNSYPSQKRIIKRLKTYIANEAITPMNNLHG